MLEFLLDVEDYWNEALKKLLMGLKHFHFEDTWDLVRDGIEFIEENVIWAIDDNFGQASNRSLLYDFICWFFQYDQRLPQELSLEDLQLLLLVFDFVEYIPHQLSHGFTQNNM